MHFFFFISFFFCTRPNDRFFFVLVCLTAQPFAAFKYILIDIGGPEDTEPHVTMPSCWISVTDCGKRSIFFFFFCCLFFSLYLFIYFYCTYGDHLLMLFYGPVDDWGATVVQFNTIQMRRWTGDCWLDDHSSINERLIDLPVSISNSQNWMWWAMACCWQVFKAHRWRRHSGSLCFHIVFKKVWLRHYQFIGVFLSAFRSQLVRWTQSISTKSPALQRLKRRDPVQFLKSCWGHVNLSARIAAILGDLLANLE